MRALKLAVVVMGVLIVAGTTVLVATIATRLSVPGATDKLLSLDEPAGTRIVAIAGPADRLAVQLQGGGPDRVVLIDPRSLRVLGRITLGH